MRTIFGFLVTRGEAPMVFGNSSPEEAMEMHDAMGGWFLTNLTLPQYQRLAVRMTELEADMPRVIAHWNEDRKPVFLSDFQQFCLKLDDRIKQLQPAD